MQQQRPMAGGKPPESSGGRQVLIVLAVVLALLVLLCAGVISFLVKQQNANAMGELGTPAAAIQADSADLRTPSASYRLTKQAAASHSLIHATEGRQTL
jgi:serine/threonine-protein kinase